MAAQCPHGCSRCRAIEAGYGGQFFSPAMFAEVFGVVEQEHSNGRTPATVEAWQAVEAEQARYEQAHAAVGVLIGRLSRRRGAPDAELEEALEVAAEERTRAADALTSARIRYHESAKADELRHSRDEYDAGQLAMARERSEREQARTARGAGVLARLRKGRS